MKKNDGTEKILKIFTKFSDRTKSEYAVHDVTVYIYSLSESKLNMICGQKVENTVLEKYLSYDNTIVLRSPVGLKEASHFRSRMITQFRLSDVIYLIIISSYQIEAFKKASASNIINDIINNVQKECETI